MRTNTNTGGGGGAGTVTSVSGANSIVSSPNPIVGAGSLQLVNDALAPGNNYYYGTDGTGVKGFFTLPTPGLSSTLLQHHLFVGDATNVAVDGGVDIQFDPALVKLSIGGVDTMSIDGSPLPSNIQVHASGQPAVAELHSFGSGLSSIYYTGYANGTFVSPTIATNGNLLGIYGALGYNGTDYSVGGYTAFQVNGTPTATSMPTDFHLYLAPTGSTTGVERIFAGADGDFTAGDVGGSGNSTIISVIDSLQQVFLGATSQTFWQIDANLQKWTGMLGANSSMLIDSNTGLMNTILGFATGGSITTGQENAFYGAISGGNTTSGKRNAFFGFQAGSANTIGDGNSAFGWDTGLNLTTGSHNTFLGQQAGNHVTTADSNVAVGYSALFDNITGIENVAIGTSALYAFLEDSNTAVGFSAGAAKVTGIDSSFFGANAGIGDTDSIGSTFIGANSGQNVTTLNNYLTTLGALSGVLADSTDSAIALGYAALTQRNFCVIGGDDGSGNGTIQTLLWGNGVTSDTPVPQAGTHDLKTTDYNPAGTPPTDGPGGIMRFMHGDTTGIGAFGMYQFMGTVTGATGDTINARVLFEQKQGTSVVTTDATVVNGTLIDALPDGVYNIHFKIACAEVGGTSWATMEVQNGFDMASGTLTTSDTDTVEHHGTASWTDPSTGVAFSIQGGGTGLGFKRRGVAATDINWTIAWEITYAPH